MVETVDGCCRHRQSYLHLVVKNRTSHGGALREVHSARETSRGLMIRSTLGPQLDFQALRE
jgi:hypothetical protein